MRIFKRFFKECPLSAFLVISFIVLNIIGLAGIFTGVLDNNISMTHPVIASVFEYDSKKEDEGKYVFNEVPIKPLDPSEEPTEKPTDTDNDVTETSEENTLENDQQDNKNQTVDRATVSADCGKVEYVARSSQPPRSGYYDEVNVRALSTAYNYQTVDKDFFSNSLFIGDSRIEGLCRYGGIDTASFCFREGVTVWDIENAEMLDGNYNKTTLASTLSNDSFDYIYVMIGINELGKGTPTSFANQYREVLQYIKQYQPSAIFVIMGIMNVTGDYSDGNDVFNNDNINARNVSISYLTNGVNAFYLDVNDSISENGGMIESYSWDGIHLKAEYYPLWSEYLYSHAIVK